ncbi:MAG: hypothetical protein EA369_10040 [Bradymonadales bacterium]|nr:MAG: hypothetical protein EA369_10040 [Bradymonadales bacterium]
MDQGSVREHSVMKSRGKKSQFVLKSLGFASSLMLALGLSSSSYSGEAGVVATHDLTTETMIFLPPIAPGDAPLERPIIFLPNPKEESLHPFLVDLVNSEEGRWKATLQSIFKTEKEVIFLFSDNSSMSFRRDRIFESEMEAEGTRYTIYESVARPENWDGRRTIGFFAVPKDPSLPVYFTPGQWFLTEAGMYESEFDEIPEHSPDVFVFPDTLPGLNSEGRLVAIRGPHPSTLSDERLARIAAHFSSNSINSSLPSGAYQTEHLLEALRLAYKPGEPFADRLDKRLREHYELPEARGGLRILQASFPNPRTRQEGLRRSADLAAILKPTGDSCDP